MRFNYAPKSMSVNDICKLFFGEDSLPARHRQRGQDRYFIDRGTSDYSDPYDKPGMVWRGMDYDAFVTKLKEAAVARADDTIQDEIGRAEAPLQATEGALAEGGGKWEMWRGRQGRAWGISFGGGFLLLSKTLVQSAQLQLRRRTTAGAASTRFSRSNRGRGTRD